MRATIVVDDNMMLIDGVACTVDCSALVGEGKHAVQWYDTYGEVEFRTDINPETKAMARLPNEIISDFSPYQSYVDAWHVEKEKQDQIAAEKQKDAEAALIETQQQQQADQQRFKDEIVEEVLRRLQELKI
jgi:hypothetical protein